MGRSEDQLHREYNDRVAECEKRSREHPEDWNLFAECADEITALSEQLEVDLAALPKAKSKRKWWKR